MASKSTAAGKPLLSGPAQLGVTSSNTYVLPCAQVWLHAWSLSAYLDEGNPWVQEAVQNPEEGGSSGMSPAAVHAQLGAQSCRNTSTYMTFRYGI